MYIKTNDSLGYVASFPHSFTTVGLLDSLLNVSQEINIACKDDVPKLSV